MNKYFYHYYGKVTKNGENQTVEGTLTLDAPITNPTILEACKAEVLNSNEGGYDLRGGHLVFHSLTLLSG